MDLSILGFFVNLTWALLWYGSYLFIGTLQTYMTLLALSNKYPRLVNFKASNQNDKNLGLQPFVETIELDMMYKSLNMSKLSQKSLSWSVVSLLVN